MDPILIGCVSIHIIELLPFTEGGQGLSLPKILNRGRGLKNFSVKREPSKNESFSVKKGDVGYEVLWSSSLQNARSVSEWYMI